MMETLLSLSLTVAAVLAICIAIYGRQP